MDRFMKRAVELALQNVEEGGSPFGAVLVRNEEIVSEGVNETHKKFDVSGHAELLAVRRAQEKLRTNDLSGFTMYASGEPCPMCLSAMYYAGIDKVYYCQSIEEATEVGISTSAFILEELKKEKKERTMPMIQIPLEEHQKNPMKEWYKRKDNL